MNITPRILGDRVQVTITHIDCDLEMLLVLVSIGHLLNCCDI